MSTRLRVHPLAAKVPPMTPQEYAEFKEDIKRAGGNLEPIPVLNNEMLDGRHRYKACRELKLEPFFREYNERDEGPVDAYIRSCQMRRNMTPSQRRVWAQECLEWEKAKAKERQGQGGGRGNKKTSGTNVAEVSEPQRATDKAGEAAGVSGKTVERDAKFKAENPVLYQAVADGMLEMSTAKSAASVFEGDAVQRAVLENVAESGDTDKAMKEAVKRKRDQDKPKPPPQKYPASDAVNSHIDRINTVIEYWKQEGGLADLLDRDTFDQSCRQSVINCVGEIAKTLTSIWKEIK